MMYQNYDEKDIQSFEYETTIVSDGNIIGTCELGKATIKLLNDSNEYSTYKDSWIKTIHGSFYVYDVKPVQEKVNIELSCYDIKYKLDTPYVSSNHTFPCTLKEWRNSIFDDCDVEYDNSDFPNSDLLLNQEPYVGENPSNRSVICLIAQAGASSVVTDSDDKFYFVWFDDETVHIATDWTELTTERNQTQAINTVVLGRGDVEDNVYYPDPRPENPKEFRIDNNYILDPQDTSTTTDLRYETCIPIYNQVNGFSYIPFSMRTQNIENKLSVKLGQKVSYEDIYDNQLESYVMTKKITYLGGDLEEDNNYEINLSAEEIKETSTDFSYASNVPNDILIVSRKADKNSGQIEDLIRNVSTLQDETGNMYTKEDVDRFFIDAKTGVTNTFSTSGGNNIFRNTGLWFETGDQYNPYEFWNGIVAWTEEKNAQNMGALLLQIATVSQEQQVANGKYTVSFKYKKLIEPATVKCTINNIEYTLNGTDETEFEQTIDVNSQYINVQFSSDITNSCEIYDLMVNSGEVKLAYTQNQNETTTDTVNISKGITITSSNSKTTFKATADGIRTLDENGNTLTEFTDVGMTNKTQIIEEQATIVSLLHKRVGNHVWVSKI